MELGAGFRKVVFFPVRSTVSYTPSGIFTQLGLVAAEGYCLVLNALKRLLQIWVPAGFGVGLCHQKVFWKEAAERASFGGSRKVSKI